MAGFCAFICPGLGHLVVGKPFQAILWFVLIVAGYFLFVVPGIVLHFISILDAARQSKRDAVSAVAKGMSAALAADRKARKQ